MPASDQINDTLGQMDPMAFGLVTLAIVASILYGIRSTIIRGLNLVIDAYARSVKRKLDARFSELPDSLTDVEKADRVLTELKPPKAVSDTWRMSDVDKSKS